MTVSTTIDPALPALTTIFNPAELSALFSHPVHADRLRHKQGVSAVARLRARAPQESSPAGSGSGATPEAAPRWLATYAPHHAPKLDKTLTRATRHGHHLEVVELPGRHTLVSGPISLDMKLYDTLQAFNGHTPLALEPSAVLNYNPHRRVVFRIETAAGPMVCKAGATNPAETAFLAELTARGVPVLQRITPPDLPHTSTLRYYPWFGQGDLHQAAARQDHDVTRSAHSAGAAIALLHAQPAHLALRRRNDPLDKLRSLSKRQLHLTSTNQTRLERIQAALARRLSEGDRAVLVHGDFSADQVLVDSPGVLLADFDRYTVAPPGMDLGSFVAVDLLQARTSGRELRSDFLTGYEEAGGRINEKSLLAWTAVHLLDRLNEPFRSCSPFWQDETEERLEMLAALVP